MLVVMDKRTGLISWAWVGRVRKLDVELNAYKLSGICRWMCHNFSASQLRWACGWFRTVGFRRRTSRVCAGRVRTQPTPYPTNSVQW